VLLYGLLYGHVTAWYCFYVKDFINLILIGFKLDFSVLLS